MSRNRKTTAGLLGIALTGLALSGSAFAMHPLAQGYVVATSHGAAEGKCGEGKCGDVHFAKGDADRDGRVSRAEFLAVAPTHIAEFATTDVDNDGFISSKESYESVKAAYEANGKKLPPGLFANPGK
ncbi:MAG TPA: EF-hand domain-containing protein [Lysobacter sp.]|nr:EF-hand domain-containing protein [Lysobacter sp.]